METSVTLEIAVAMERGKWQQYDGDSSGDGGREVAAV